MLKSICTLSRGGGGFNKSISRKLPISALFCNAIQISGHVCNWARLPSLTSCLNLNVSFWMPGINNLWFFDKPPWKNRAICTFNCKFIGQTNPSLSECHIFGSLENFLVWVWTKNHRIGTFLDSLDLITIFFW